MPRHGFVWIVCSVELHAWRNQAFHCELRINRPLEIDENVGVPLNPTFLPSAAVGVKVAEPHQIPRSYVCSLVPSLINRERIDEGVVDSSLKVDVESRSFGDDVHVATDHRVFSPKRNRIEFWKYRY